jgi:adenosine kinase
MFSGPELTEMIGRAAALTVNDYEARVVEQKTGKRIDEIARLTEAVIVTKGAEGCTIVTSGGEKHVPAVPPEALADPTGCGDAFRAGILYGMARDWEWQRSAQLAAVMGSIKIAHRGGQNHRPGREAIAQRLAQAFGENL